MTGAIAPILKIRAVLRRRVRATLPRHDSNVSDIQDDLMLGWAEDEVRSRAQTGDLLAAADHQFDDLRALAVRVVRESEVSRLDALMLFSKLEAARGLIRQAQNLAALCCFLFLLSIAIHPAPLDPDDGHAMRRTRGGVRVVRVRSSGRSAGRREEVA